MIGYKVAFSLLANAYRFYESAVAHARQRTERDDRFAVLHLATALETLLKAKIALRDHTLLMPSKGGVPEDRLLRGAVKTIRFDEAVVRLEELGCVLPDRGRQLIDNLRDIRNRIAHFSGTLNDETLDTLAHGFSVFIDLYVEDFRDDPPYGAKAIGALVSDLTDFPDFITARRSHIEERLRSAVRPRTRHLDECPVCNQDAAVLANQRVECLFCGRLSTIRGVATGLSRDGSAGECPICECDSIATHQWGESPPTRECFVCGYYEGPELRWCDAQGGLLPRLKR